MSYLVIQILGSLFLAGVLGALFTWAFLQSSYREKIRNIKFEWQERLRINSFIAHNKLIDLEESFRLKLEEKQSSYRQYLKNREMKYLSKENEWREVVQDLEITFKDCLTDNDLTKERQTIEELRQENLRLRKRLDTTNPK